MTTVFGWDASDYDWNRGPVDVQAASRDGILFFTHKSVETTASEIFYHVHYAEALNRARDVAQRKDGALRYYGSYVVPRTGISVDTQVQVAVDYWDTVTPWWRTDPCFFIQVDLERWEYDDVPASVGEEMVRKFEPYLPTAVLLYASQGQYGDQLSADMIKWNANYAAEQAPTRHYLDIYAHVGGDNGPGWAPYSGSPAPIWQYASDATIGSQNTCDANAFRGTADQFADTIHAPRDGGTGGGETPPQPQPPQTPPGEIPRWDNVTLDPVGEKLADILAYYPKPAEIYITSGTDGDHGSVSYHYANLYYQGSLCAAIDIGFGGTAQPAAGRDVAKWLYDNFSDLTVELIHTTPFADDQGFYVKDQVQYPGGGPYDQGTMNGHADHVHWATSDHLANQILTRLGAGGGAGPSPTPPPSGKPWPSYMPAGHYFGLITGPERSHGGYYPQERPDVQAIQRRLIELGHVPGITDPNSGWADGIFEQPTYDAVATWQRALWAAQTTRYGEVWSDDWSRLFG